MSEKFMCTTDEKLVIVFRIVIWQKIWRLLNFGAALEFANGSKCA